MMTNKPIRRDEIKHMPKGNKDDGGKGNKKGDDKGGRYGAYGGYKGVKRSDATKLVNADLHELIRNLHHEMKQNHRETKREIKQARHEYGRTKDDLNSIYGETGDFLKNQNDQMLQHYTQAGDQSRAAQAALMQQLQGSAQQANGDVNGELERLGMGQAGNTQQFLSQLQADQANNASVAGINQMNNMANLDAMNMGAQQVGNLLLGMNQGGQTAALGQARRDRNDAITGIRDDSRDAKFDIRNAMRDARAGKHDSVMQLLQQMAQTGWAQYMDNRSQKFNEWLSKQQLGLDRQSLALQAQSQNADLQQQNAYNGTLSNLYQTQLGHTYGNNGGGGGPVGPGHAGPGHPHKKGGPRKHSLTPPYNPYHPHTPA